MSYVHDARMLLAPKKFECDYHACTEYLKAACYACTLEKCMHLPY